MNRRKFLLGLGASAAVAATAKVVPATAAPKARKYGTPKRTACSCRWHQQ